MKDTGKGMSKEAVEHIFERFYTVNEQRSDSNGIGLSLVKELASVYKPEPTASTETNSGLDKLEMSPLDKKVLDKVKFLLHLAAFFLIAKKKFRSVTQNVRSVTRNGRSKSRNVRSVSRNGTFS